jgi:hypothetical protein
MPERLAQVDQRRQSSPFAIPGMVTNGLSAQELRQARKINQIIAEKS